MCVPVAQVKLELTVFFFFISLYTWIAASPRPESFIHKTLNSWTHLHAPTYEKIRVLAEKASLRQQSIVNRFNPKGEKPATSEGISIPHPRPARAARCLNDAALSLHCLDAQQTLWAHKRNAAWFSGAPSFANVAPQWTGGFGQTSPSAGPSDWEAGN